MILYELVAGDAFNIVPVIAYTRLGQRQRQMDRCRQFINQVEPAWVIPSAGPPCFLDDGLRQLNDVYDDPANIFPDQVVFLGQMRHHGLDNGLLMIPGTSATFAGRPS